MTHQAHLNLTDAELELHIADCGRLFLKAHGEGDMPLARHWLAEQTKAVKPRSPGQVNRMHDCYFASEGDRARLEATRREAL